ncbi:MAG TPA: cytochrome P450 [Methylomirabilota bacterium]|nr:cytochrome P450 [Methylomirabilota bacterium]
MSAAGGARRLRFNPFSEEFRRDPYAVYRRLREAEPMHRVLGMWVLTRYADVAAVLRDRRFSSRLFPDAIEQHQPKGGQRFHRIESFIAKAIVFTDNPDHSRLRRLVGGCFSPEAVEAERPHVEALVDRLLDRALAAGGMEAMGEFADEIPLHVTADRLGLPEDGRRQVREWTHLIRFLLDPSLMAPDDYVRVEAAAAAFMEYVRPLVGERRARPTADVITRLLESRAGDDRLSEDEVILTCIMSFVAGHETTKYLIGNGLLALLQHPAQRARLRGEPGRVGAAVDEVLRYDAPLQQTKRVALEDVDVGGQTIRRGDKVLLCLGAANHDPARFERPEVFDIGRTDNAHFGFGYGMRACLGGALAHLEAAVALSRFTARAPDPALTDEPLAWQDHSRILRGLTRLPIRFG